MNLTNIVENWPTIALIGTFILAVSKGIIDWQRGGPEREKVITDSAVNLIDRLAARLEEVEQEVGELRDSVKELKKENEWLKTGIAILVNQLQQHDIPPLWTPESPRPAERQKKEYGRSDKGNKGKRGF